jgi:TonB family protein
VANKVDPPQLRNSIEAQFSYEARKKNINGRCLVSLNVDISGLPQEIKLIRCSDSSFQKSSLDAVENYRFKPATTQEGLPVSFKLVVVVDYRRTDIKDMDVVTPIRYEFSPPPGDNSSNRGAHGVYLLTLADSPPKITMFSDNGYADAAFYSPKGNGACDIVLTVSTKGKASEAQVIHCEQPAIEEHAVESLLRSKYKPGSLNGKAVSMRASIHLEYGDAPLKP